MEESREGVVGDRLRWGYLLEVWRILGTFPDRAHAHCFRNRSFMVATPAWHQWLNRGTQRQIL